MKILVLQLARFGDILTTWPALSALRRANPGAEIDILVRHRFRDACEGLTALNRVWTLDSDAILEPLLSEDASVEESLKRLEQFVAKLTREKYELVLNLSFSPASAFLARAFERAGSNVRGYSRNDDGSLKLSDEYSAYFYAQVGIGKPNRVHLADLLAGVAQVELQPGDWQAAVTAAPAPSIAVHVGASQEQKSYPTERWAVAIQEILKWWGHDVVLIGSPGERSKADKVAELLDNTRVKNIVGETKFAELFGIVGTTTLLIGCDSAPLHVASLTQTPTLNLSFATVNFWETGPKAAGSRVLWALDAEHLEPAWVSEEARRLVAGEPARNCRAEVTGPTDFYVSLLGEEQDFEWLLLKGMYFGFDMPRADFAETQNGLIRLIEINNLAREQLSRLTQNPKDSVPMQILNRADEMVATVGSLVPALSPLVRWLQTRKIAIQPGPLSAVLSATAQAHQDFATLLARFKSDAKEIWL